MTHTHTSGDPSLDRYSCCHCGCPLLNGTDTEQHRGEDLCGTCFKDAVDEEEQLEREAELHAPKYD